ncbi:MAG: DUF427 domain-containing protein [Pseudomonadota bacterium]
MADLPSKDQLLRRVAVHRSGWGAGPKPPADPIGPGEESVWDYPRPPEVRPPGPIAAPNTKDVSMKMATGGPVVATVIFDRKTLAKSHRALRICETAGAPVWYFPPEDVNLTMLVETDALSVCEWKGAAVYYDVVSHDLRARQAAFCYPDPLDDLGMGYGQIAGWFGFYPARVEACFVGREHVRPQPGDLYAGWVTDAIKGPIKGGPGTGHW